ncbi:MAG: M20 family metallopeptidase, partial [Candidatus Aminicenantes bacterium]|nr:M20 family metallopeptidase [Candidatus Aminicenantes bacterium]
MDIPAAVEAEVEKRRGEIIALSREIHARPELAFEERETSRLLQAVLQREGFGVSAGTAGLETAFRAVAEGSGGGGAGSGRPRLIYTAEMDALPGLGHACGHNIIAAAAVWSAVVVKSVLGRALEGSVEVVGSPAEERGSGKVALIEAGVFDGADAVLQMHPHALDTVVGQAMARRSLSVAFFGRKAHAAAAPGEGRNALDALVLFYHSLILRPGRLPAGCL